MTKHGVRAEHGQEGGGHADTIDALRRAAARHVEAGPYRSRHAVEDRVLGLDIEVLPEREPITRNIEARRPLPQHCEALGVRIRERAEQKPVRHAENGAGRSDTDRERQERRYREARGFDEGADTVHGRWMEG